MALARSVDARRGGVIVPVGYWPAVRMVSLPVRWLPWVLAGCFAALYAVVSLRRHDLMETRAFDLGIFEQAVRGYASGAGPVVDLKGPGFNLLGDHFSPGLAVLAPIYQALPYTATLLVVQAVLLAVSIVPVTRWALDALGERAAWGVGLAMGASWGLVQAVAFDFHEIALAVPLLAFSLVALGEGRTGAAVLWALPLLLVKEDLGLTVAVIGLLVALRGSRRTGIATAIAGLGGAFITVVVLVPAASSTGAYPYWGKVEGRSYVEVLLGMVSPTSVWTLVLLLAPTAFLASRSSLLLVAAPTLLWRLASDNPAYHGTDYHYNAVLAPIVFTAFVAALQRSSASTRRRALVASVLVTLVLVPVFSLRTLMAPPDRERAAAVASARDLLALIPDGATVAASNMLAPQLTDRTTVFLFGAVRRPVTCPQYIAVNRGNGRWREEDFPSSGVAQVWLYYQARAHGYQEVAADGWVSILRYTGATDTFYSRLIADGPPAYLTDPHTGGTEDAGDFTWTCHSPR